ncbi:methyltransferase [Geodermatophilus maliterrae]|uniref:Methyltransferase n=1 Tax=Geodermatophilus maliterrae TaxID=3162531 RepID=A0ABV3XMU8_9ACTN
MPATGLPLDEADYLRVLVHGTTAFELLRTALQLGLFEHIEDNDGLDIAGAARLLGVEEQPARVLLMGLSSLLLLDKRDGRYVNAPMTRRKLLRSGERFLGPLVDVQARVINPSMVDLAESVRQATNVGLRHVPGPGDTLYSRLTAQPDLQQVFYANMGDASGRAFAQFLEHYDLTDVRHVIDIGGGDGTNGIELARRYPQLQVTVFDQPTVTDIAASRIADPAVRDRVHFRAGDLFDDPLPQGADAIMYFHVFEIWSLERNVELLRKCHTALPEGGSCLVYNFASNEEGTGPASAGLVSPYFLTLASGEGMTYSASEMAQAVRDAGFREVRCHPDLGFSHALVVGRK